MEALGWLFILVLFIAAAWAHNKAPKSCDCCGAPIKNKYYRWSNGEVKEVLCPRCNSYRERKRSAAAAKARYG
jgi:hypothetical protein